MGKLIFLKRPLLISAILALLFSLTAFYFRKSVLFILISVFFFIGVFLIFISNKKVAVILLFPSFVLISSLNAYETVDRVELLSGGYVHETFVAVGDQNFENGYSKIEIKCLSGKVLPKGIKIDAVQYDDIYIKCGSIFNATLKVEKIKENFYKRISFGNGEYCIGTLSKVQISDQYNSFYKITGEIRRYLRKVIRNFMTGDPASLAVAMTVGDSSSLSDNAYADFTDIGITHIMVVSGLHLSIVLGGVFSVINRFFRNKYFQFILSVLSIFLFCGVCGFTYSILRAGILFLAFCFAPLVNRDSDSLSSLSLAAVLILAVNPFAIFSVAFELSFVSAFSIIVIAPFYSKLIIKACDLKSKFLIGFVKAFMTSLSAVLFTTPVIVYVYKSVSLVTVLANLLTIYAVSGVLIFNLIGFIVPEFSILLFLKGFVFWISEICSKYILAVANILSSLPFSSVKIGYWLIVVSLVIMATVIVYKIYYEIREEKIFLEEWYSAGNKRRNIKK